MKHTGIHTIKRRGHSEIRPQWAVGMACLLTLWLGGEICFGQGKMSTTIYYEVTYRNKEVLHSPDIPTMNQNILMVTKVVQYQSSSPSYESISSGSHPIEVTNPPRVIKTRLRWNGSAWVDAVKSSGRINAPQASRSYVSQDVDNNKVTKGSTAAMKQQMARTLEQLSQAKQMLAELEKQLQSSKPSLSAARQTLTAAQRKLDQAIQSAVAAGRSMQTLLSCPQARAVIHSVTPDGKMFYDNTRPSNTYPSNASVLRSHVQMSGGAGGWGPRNRYWDSSMNVYTEQPNPDYDPGPRVIIRRTEGRE